MGATLDGMHRRRLLQLGLAAAAVVAVGGAAVSWTPSPFSPDGRLQGHARSLFAAAAVPLLEGSLPPDAARQVALLAQAERVDATVAGLPPHVRRELATLLRLMGTAAGRRVLCGTAEDWAAMSTSELSQVLANMRTSSIGLRVQVFQAFREITVGAYFADPSTWAGLGYPGPLPL